MLLAQFDENKQFKMFQSVQIALAPQVHAIHEIYLCLSTPNCT